LGIYEVAPFYHSELEFIFLPKSIGVVASSISSYNELKSKAIDEAVLFKAYDNFVAMFFTLNIRNFFDLIVDDFGMSPSNNELKFS
jgi:hypothetical protein